MIFKKMLGDMVECYVDNLVVKSREKFDHLEHLRVVFDKHHQHEQKMNPRKCEIGVTSGKFLGFVVCHKEI